MVLRIHAFTARGAGLILGWGTKNQHTSWCGQKVYKNSYLKSLAIVLRAYRKCRNIHSRKSTQSLEEQRLWYIGADLLLYPPLPQTLYSGVLWAAVAKRWGSLSPPDLSHWTWFHLGKPASISYPHPEALFQTRVAKRTSSPFP